MKERIFDNKIFFAEILDQINNGKEVKIRAKGRSMTPLIRDGKDYLVLGTLKEDSIEVGRIVLALYKDIYVVHRITHISDNVIKLRGDGNPYQVEEVERTNILAELVAFERKGQMFTSDSLRWRMYRYLWPRNGFLRRLLLYIYRRL